ncbi:MAG TPA: hypothetical protein VJO53_10095 [Candidatus Acidoferrales bacterium]|nr:hypothetical protein [Candidatus Acidoferrales bacterium]
MALFVVFVLGPALLFNVYALTRFSRERKRARDDFHPRGNSAVRFLAPHARDTGKESLRAAKRPKDLAAAKRRRVVVLCPLEKRPARRDVA